MEEKGKRIWKKKTNKEKWEQTCKQEGEQELEGAEGDRKGRKQKRIKLYYVQIPHDKCNHYIFQIYINKK